MGLFFSFSLYKIGVREVMFAKHQLAIVFVPIYNSTLQI